MSKTMEVAMKPYPQIFVLLIVFSLILSGCSASGEAATPTPESGRQDFEAVISATGIVVPEQWAELSARSQAVMAEVLVTEGERVSAGQLLVRLDGQAAAQANLSAAQYELISAQQALETLKENAATARARAQQAVANAQQAMQDAQDDADSLYYPRASETRIKNTQAEIDLAKKALTRAQDSWRQVARLEDGNEKKAQALAVMTDAQLYLNELIAKYNWYVGNPTDIDAAKYRAALAVAQADLARSQAEYDRCKDGPDTNLLAQGEARLALAKAQVLAAEEAVANLELRAPFEGVICNLDVRVGEWVTPGIPILQLGDLDNLRVETTDLSEIDAARLHPQDVALVTFDALPNVTIPGTVLRVASKSAAGSGVNYTAVIVLDTIPAGLLWGMTAFADIEVSE